MSILRSVWGLREALRGGGCEAAESVAPQPAGVEITDEPERLESWSSADARDGLSRLEQDVRALMREVAHAKFREAEREREHSEALRKLYVSLAEAIDALDRVFRGIHAKEEQVTPQMTKWITNFRTVRTLLERTLSDGGVVRIESVDQGFDPNWHSVAEVVVDASRPEGTILEEIQRGYVWRKQVLRRAEVVVVGQSGVPRGIPEGDEGKLERDR